MFSRLAAASAPRFMAKAAFSAVPRSNVFFRALSTEVSRPHLIVDYTDEEKANFTQDHKDLYYFPVEEQPVGGLMKAIARYGTYPFVSLGFILLVSKEWYMLDTEFLMMMNYILLVTSGYILFGEQVAKSLYDDREEMLRVIRGHDEFACAMIRYDRRLCEKMLLVPGVYSELKTELSELNKKVVNVRDYNQRLTYHNSIVSQLEQQVVREAEEASRKQGEDAYKTLYHLISVFEGPKAQQYKDAVLAEAIEMVGGTKEDKLKNSFATIDKMIEEFANGKK